MIPKTKVILEREAVIVRQAAKYYALAVRDYSKSRKPFVTRISTIKKSIAAKQQQAQELYEEVQYIDGLVVEETKELQELLTTIKQTDINFYKEYDILAQQAKIQPQQFDIEV